MEIRSAVLACGLGHWIGSRPKSGMSTAGAVYRLLRWAAARSRARSACTPDHASSASWASAATADHRQRPRSKTHQAKRKGRSISSQSIPTSTGKPPRAPRLPLP